MLAYLTTIALLAHHVAAQGNMLRFACSQLVVDRVDPIVQPGIPYAAHLHQIVGGNSFNLTMDPANHDLPSLSTCTSCSFKEDFSNYWTAVMFFHHKNGSYIRVPQTGNGGPQGQLDNKGGLDVYYIPSGKVTAFKPVSDSYEILGRLVLIELGFPYDCRKRCEHSGFQGEQAGNLQSLLDRHIRHPLCGRRTLLW
jgi:hypothetical protein